MKNALAILLLSLTVTGCFDRGPTIKPAFENLLDLISHDSTFHFPADSTVVEFVQDNKSISDRDWAAKVILPKGSTENFLKEISIKKTDDVAMVNSLSDRVAWWKPRKIVAQSRYRTGAGLTDLLISEEEEGVVVYIQFHPN